MSTVRLIVITLPPPPVAREIRARQESLGRRYGTLWALRYPPHVTLRTGLIVPEENLEEVFRTFSGLSAQTRSFCIQTSPSCVGRMVYENEDHFFLSLPVVRSPEIMALHTRLLSYTRYRKSEQRSFTPHVTLFWGDLPEEDAQVLCQDVTEEKPPWHECYSWTCNSVSLYAMRGSQWEPVKTFPFQEAN